MEWFAYIQRIITQDPSLLVGGVLILMIWLVSGLIIIPSARYTTAVLHMDLTICMEDWSSDSQIDLIDYYITLFAFEFCFPVIIMVICYSQIARHVWSQRHLPGQASLHAQRRRLARSKRRYAMLLLLVLVFIICSSPYYGFALYQSVMKEHFQTHHRYGYQIFLIVEAIALSNGMFNVCITLALNENMGQCVKQLLSTVIRPLIPRLADYIDNSNPSSSSASGAGRPRVSSNSSFLPRCNSNNMTAAGGNAAPGSRSPRSTVRGKCPSPTTLTTRNCWQQDLASARFLLPPKQIYNRPTGNIDNVMGLQALKQGEVDNEEIDELIVPLSDIKYTLRGDGIETNDHTSTPAEVLLLTEFKNNAKIAKNGNCKSKI